MDYVGFLDSGMTHEAQFNDSFFDPEKCIMYVQWTDQSIVVDHQWSIHTTSDGTCMDSVLKQYNEHFHTHHILFDLEGMCLSTRFCGIYPTETFKKLGSFLSKLSDTIYRKFPQTYWGINGVHMDRAISLFHALQAIEGHVVSPLPISRSVDTIVADTSTNDQDLYIAMPTQFSPLYDVCARYDTNIRAKYIDDITTTCIPSHAVPAMNTAIDSAHSKTLCLVNDTKQIYLCDSIRSEGQCCLAMTEMHEHASYRLEGQALDAAQPRAFLWNQEMYVVFQGTCPESSCRKFAVTTWDVFHPFFLEFPENTIFCCPLIKDKSLYFIIQCETMMVYKYNEATCTVKYIADVKEPSFCISGSNFVENGEHHFSGIISDHTYTYFCTIEADTWTMVNVSKPIMYPFPVTKETILPTIDDTMILDVSSQGISIKRPING